ncbi:hypothetical protein AAFF_G00341560 [Aldrovandia affinis]|uniref:Uncharacterized protein n=1 Tax=Aldrovandia affinis TaxID=143900 RepID=A0AAD7WPN3_9TELE|nr:hypothetical protein AAFF_G00341560 [Aldrovandia affinis]
MAPLRLLLAPTASRCISAPPTERFLDTASGSRASPDATSSRLLRVAGVGGPARRRSLRRSPAADTSLSGAGGALTLCSGFSDQPSSAPRETARDREFSPGLLPLGPCRSILDTSSPEWTGASILGGLRLPCPEGFTPPDPTRARITALGTHGEIAASRHGHLFLTPTIPPQRERTGQGLAMSGNGNHCPAHMGGFPMPHYSYFFPHMLGGLSPPTIQGLPVSGYSTPSPASKYPASQLCGNFRSHHCLCRELSGLAAVSSGTALGRVSECL